MINIKTLTAYQKSELVKLIVSDAVNKGMTVGHFCQHLNHLCGSGSTISVYEACATSLAYTDKITAIYALFSSMDASVPVADHVTEPFATAKIWHEGKVYYRFSEDPDFGVTCSFGSLFGDLEWFKHECVLAENKDGVFEPVKRPRLKLVIQHDGHTHSI
jgi:hypothetical protein